MRSTTQAALAFAGALAATIAVAQQPQTIAANIAKFRELLR